MAAPAFAADHCRASSCEVVKVVHFMSKYLDKTKYLDSTRKLQPHRTDCEITGVMPSYFGTDCSLSQVLTPACCALVVLIITTSEGETCIRGKEMWGRWQVEVRRLLYVPLPRRAPPLFEHDGDKRDSNLFCRKEY